LNDCETRINVWRKHGLTFKRPTSIAGSVRIFSLPHGDEPTFIDSKRKKRRCVVTDDIVTQPCCDVRPCGCADARMVIDHLHAEIERMRKAGDQLAYWALQENLAGELISAAKAWKAVRGD